MNGGLGERTQTSSCGGEYQFTGKPEKIYLTDEEFWRNFENGIFLDARGKEAELNVGRKKCKFVFGNPGGVECW